MCCVDWHAQHWEMVIVSMWSHLRLLTAAVIIQDKNGCGAFYRMCIFLKMLSHYRKTRVRISGSLHMWDQIFEGKIVKLRYISEDDQRGPRICEQKKVIFHFQTFRGPNYWQTLCMYSSFSWRLAIFSILLLMYQAFLYIVWRTIKSQSQELHINVVNVY